MKNQPNRIQIAQENRSDRRGFTLVELLVVITIIVLLATVVVFMTRKIRDKAFQANALSTLRQVAAYNVAYSTENNGDINTLRDGNDPKEGGGGAWVKNTYWGRLQPYLFADVTTNDQKQLNKELHLRLDQLFSSPDADKMTNTVISGSRVYHDTSGLPVPFGFNRNLYKWGQFLKASSFGDPSQVLYSTYGFYFFNEEDGKKYEPRPIEGAAVKNNIYYLENQSALASFLDGHVEAIQAPIPERRFK